MPTSARQESKGHATAAQGRRGDFRLPCLPFRSCRAGHQPTAPLVIDLERRDSSDSPGESGSVFAHSLGDVDRKGELRRQKVRNCRLRALDKIPMVGGRVWPNRAELDSANKMAELG